MRIVHLDAGRTMRGGQIQVLALMEGLRRKQHENILLARTGSPLAIGAAAQGFAVWPFSALQLWRESLGGTIFHAHDARSHSLAAILRRRPLVVSRRVAFPPGNGFVSRWKYGQPELFLAVSEFVAHQLASAGVARARIRIVYDGVVAPPVSGRGDEIVAIASEDPQKGNDLLQAAATTIGIKLKFSADLPADLPGARLFVYLTRQEGLGSAALLAMAYGVPVLASCVGGLPEIVIDGHTGILTRNDPAEIGKKLRAILADAEGARKLGQQGRELVLSRFTVQHMVDATELAYQELSCF